MNSIRRILTVAALVGMLFSMPSHAADTKPQAVVRAFYAQLVATMKQGDQLGIDGRYKKLAPAVSEAYNLPLMTRMAVGPAWMIATEKEKEDLISSFSKFSIATYASRFASYDGEQFTITGEKQSGNDVIVETKLKPKDEEAVTLNYLMRIDDKGDYRIVDVFMNGTISELATRRAEFSSIARREGVPALVNSLSKKSQQMGAS